MRGNAQGRDGDGGEGCGGEEARQQRRERRLFVREGGQAMRGPAMRRPARGIKVSINFGFTYWFYLFPWVKIYLVQYVGIPNAEILYIKH